MCTLCILQHAFALSMILSFQMVYCTIWECVSLQWNRWKGTHCYSLTFIRMQQQIRAAYMEAVQWLRERNGQQPDGFMWSRSKDRCPGQLGVWTRTRAARNGQRQGNVRRIQSTWWVQKQTRDIAERAAKLAHLKNQVTIKALIKKGLKIFVCREKTFGLYKQKCLNTY